MMNSNTSALGVIFPNSFDATMPELTTQRSTASIPFAGRYRMIDFVLSSMVNGGIDNISILCRENYLSLMDHLGAGREWDLTRKNGGLNIIPPFSQKESKVFHGRIEGLKNIETFLRRQKEKYIVISDANTAANFDFKDFVKTHAASGADVTIAYAKLPAPKEMPTAIREAKCNFYVLDVEDGKVKDIKISPNSEGINNISMNIMIMEREWLLDTVHQAYTDGYVYLERDILKRNINTLDIRGYEFKGYCATVFSMKTYFAENMRLLEEKNLDGLFSGNPIYTKVRDDNPTRYIGAPSVKNCMVADGCIIEDGAKVENCVLFRGVKIGKGAIVSNSILMQDTVIGNGAIVDYLIADKNVTVGEFKTFRGTCDFPGYIPKGKKA